MAFYRFGSKNLGDTAKVQPDGSGLYSILTGVAGQPDVVWVTVRQPSLPDANLTLWPKQSVVTAGPCKVYIHSGGEDLVFEGQKNAWGSLSVEALVSIR
jgi:hypothetical protein